MDGGGGKPLVYFRLGKVMGISPMSDNCLYCHTQCACMYTYAVMFM